MKKMTLITGAAGMIGSCLVRYLNDQGEKDLLLVDDLKCADKWKNLVTKQFIDLIFKKDLFSWLGENAENVDAIVHLGACSDTVEKDADYLLENNYRYSIRLAEWALERNIRFIYASSAATYGDGEGGFVDDEHLLESLQPLNMYGYSKHLVDLWMKRRNVLDRVVGLKYFNVFGPNEYHKGRMASMVLKMMQNNHDGSTVRLFKSNHPDYTDGNQMRDFVYVKDVARITASFLSSENRHLGGIYNVGLGKPTTWNELTEAFFEAIEKPCQIAYVDMPEDLEKQYQYYTCASMNKLFSSLSLEKKHLAPAGPSSFESFSPQKVWMTPIREAVKDYVQNYLRRDARW